MEKFKEMEEESEKRMVEQEERFMHQMNLMETERMRLEEDREERFRQEDRAFLERTLNKGNNKITELRTILQRESQNS
jgi:hypothetical protein